MADHAMSRASRALLDADRTEAAAVVAGEQTVETMHHTLEEHAIGLPARQQQPVATDLRTIVACLRMSADLQRMAKLARHVAEPSASVK